MLCIRIHVYVSAYNTNIQVYYIEQGTETHLQHSFSDGWGFEGFFVKGVVFSIREFSSFSTVGRLLVARLVVNNFVFGSMLLSLYYFFGVFVYRLE